MPKLKALGLVDKCGTYFLIFLLLVIGICVSDKFLSATNLLNILDAVSYLGILACGMALVTYCGQRSTCPRRPPWR